MRPDGQGSAMKKLKVQKSFREINERIRQGKAVVVTAEEMIDIVERHGAVDAARRIDVVTTGTFSPMCSSGAFLNFGHTSPKIRASRIWLNDVPAYGGIAAVDCYLGATEVTEADPLNSVYPGEFNYGGGHVIEDLVAGNLIRLRAEGYGTDCYPARRFEKTITIHDLRDAILFNPRNAYQNYNCAVNMSDKTIYTYMGMLRPRMGNATYATSGQLSPLFNDPYYQTIGIGTRIFLGGAQGFVAWPGTQHNPRALRGKNGVPREGAGTIATIGNLKEMSPEWLSGASMLGYGVSLYVGIDSHDSEREAACFTAVRTRISGRSTITAWTTRRRGKSLGEVTTGSAQRRDRPEQEDHSHRAPLQLLQGTGNRRPAQGVDREGGVPAGRTAAAPAVDRREGRPVLSVGEFLLRLTAR